MFWGSTMVQFVVWNTLMLQDKSSLVAGIKLLNAGIQEE
uniref:Pco107270a n=1 Tax=Arundo donax TaxID=35708 RepID=A0A0A9DYZ2_ARUDO